MRKKIAIVATFLAISGAIVACGTKNQTETTATTTEETVAEETTEAVNEVTGEIKTGMAVITSIDRSTNATDADNGIAQIYSTVGAVMVDSNGVIMNASIDVVPTRIEFSKAGKIVSDISAGSRTTKELKEDYGMKAVSGLGKEWYEQAKAFEDYAIGKTIDEIKNIEVDEDGAPINEDLASSVSISIGSYIDVLEKAVANANLSGANTTDSLGLAINTDLSGTKDFADGDDGVASVENTYAAVTLDSEGKVTTAVIDGSRTEVVFDDLGQINTDFDEKFMTKRELGDDYGMKVASPIGKEWYEQADSFAEYVTGKTLEEIKNIAVSSNGAAEDADLLSSVTIRIEGFKNIIEKAISNVEN